MIWAVFSNADDFKNVNRIFLFLNFQCNCSTKGVDVWYDQIILQIYVVHSFRWFFVKKDLLTMLLINFAL